MLTIALNEYGDFHHLGQDEENIKTIHFIALVLCTMIWIMNRFRK